jgi:hypothetical protein
MVEEKEELDIKREKGEAFTRTQRFQDLDLVDRQLLREQLYFMECYSNRLTQRIARAATKES